MEASQDLEVTNSHDIFLEDFLEEDPIEGGMARISRGGRQIHQIE